MRAKISIVSILALVIALLIAGCISYKQPETPATTTEETEAPPTPPTPAIPETKENTVEITSAGFNPSTVTIKAGDKVTFTNKDTSTHWPASAVHPTHTDYPETGGCIGSKFDACKGLAQGESWSFTFNEKGSWNYHDHLNPSLKGTIVVE